MPLPLTDGPVPPSLAALQASRRALVSTAAAHAPPPAAPQAALLVIGNEILTGGVADTNTPWLAKALSATTLILVKSATIDPRLKLEQLAALQLVDKGFCAAVAQARFEIQIINAEDVGLCFSP